MNGLAGSISISFNILKLMDFRRQSRNLFLLRLSALLYRDVSVSGDIFVRDQLKRFVKVGSSTSSKTIAKVL